MRLLFATIEPYPTFRPDVATLFGKFLPRLGVTSDLVAERVPGVAGEVSWGGGEALLISSRGSRLGRYVVNLVHYARILFRADRAKYQAIQVRDMPLVALLGLLAARLKRLPFFYWMSFPAPEGQIQLARERGLSAGLIRFLFRLLWRGWMDLFLLYRIVLPRADHVFVQSDRMREDLVRKGIARQKLTPVVMGVDLEVSVPEAIAPIDDARLKGKRVLIYLGTIARGRRIEILFDMLKILRQQFLEEQDGLIADGRLQFGIGIRGKKLEVGFDIAAQLTRAQPLLDKALGEIDGARVFEHANGLFLNDRGIAKLVLRGEVEQGIVRH